MKPKGAPRITRVEYFAVGIDAENDHKPSALYYVTLSAPCPAAKGSKDLTKHLYIYAVDELEAWQKGKQRIKEQYETAKN